jgi:hypothetical protein
VNGPPPVIVVTREGHPPLRFAATGWRVIADGTDSGDLVLALDGGDWVAQIGARQWDSVHVEHALLPDDEYRITPAGEARADELADGGDSGPSSQLHEGDWDDAVSEATS